MTGVEAVVLLLPTAFIAEPMPLRSTPCSLARDSVMSERLFRASEVKDSAASPTFLIPSARFPKLLSLTFTAPKEFIAVASTAILLAFPLSISAEAATFAIASANLVSCPVFAPLSASAADLKVFARFFRGWSGSPVSDFFRFSIAVARLATSVSAPDALCFTFISRLSSVSAI